MNGLGESDFQDLLKLTTMSTVFYFNGNYYKQLEGVAMGSPLGPVLANHILCHHKSKWLREYLVSHAPIFYKRYINDIFVLLKSVNHVTIFFFFLSKFQIACEIEKDRSLAFIRIIIIPSSVPPPISHSFSQV